jgi:hypothetical protein
LLLSRLLLLLLHHQVMRLLWQLLQLPAADLWAGIEPQGVPRW